MTATFDRDKAREILCAYADWDDTLDRLEECVQPPRAFVVHSEEEFRGRIRAEAKLARIAALCDSVERAQRSEEPMVFTRRIRAVLDSDLA